MPLVMKIMINCVSCRDRVLKAARLGCRKSRVRIQGGVSRRLENSLYEVFLTPIDPTITRPQEIFIFYASLHDLATIEYGKKKRYALIRN